MDLAGDINFLRQVNRGIDPYASFERVWDEVTQEVGEELRLRTEELLARQAEARANVDAAMRQLASANIREREERQIQVNQRRIEELEGSQKVQQEALLAKQGELQERSRHMEVLQAHLSAHQKHLEMLKKMPSTPAASVLLGLGRDVMLPQQRGLK